MNQTNKLKGHTKPRPHESTDAESKEVARASQPKTTEKTKKGRGFDPQVFLATVGLKRTITQCPPDHKIFSQGEPSDAVFYIQKGRVKLTIISEQG